jgi:hypothetical protein
MKKFEAIQQQIIAQRSQKSTERRSSRPAYQIAYATGEPVTEPQERLQRILSGGWNSDPDPGQPWTVPDEKIAQTRAAQSLPRERKNE